MMPVAVLDGVSLLKYTKFLEEHRGASDIPESERAPKLWSPLGTDGSHERKGESPRDSSLRLRRGLDCSCDD
jgi:hypothetical protein